MTNKFILMSLAIIVSFISGLGLGYILTSSDFLETRQIQGQYSDTFIGGWTAARQKLIESGFIMATEIFSLSGSIEKVADNQVVLATRLMNPLDDELLKTRIALITSDTKIIIRRQKNEAEQKAEEELRDSQTAALRKQLSEAGSEEEKMNLEMQITELEMNMMAIPYKEVAGKPSDLKPGNQITVEAGEDIAQKQKFIATKIIFEEFMEMVPELMPVAEVK